MSFFPLHHCVRNVSNKLIKNVKERVDDVILQNIKEIRKYLRL